MSVVIRKAVASDQAAITALVHSERLNPTGLAWRNFHVAERGGRLVGAVQIRPHGDQAREAGSFVVVPDQRGRGLGGRLLDHVLAGETGAVYAITVRARAAYFARWGFVRQPLATAPGPVARNAVMGQIAGGLMALLKGRDLRRVVVLCRPAGTPARRRLSRGREAAPSSLSA